MWSGTAWPTLQVNNLILSQKWLKHEDWFETFNCYKAENSSDAVI
jgi:hypothetical protein